MGGHNVPEETIRRRFTSGLKNFFHLYEPLADSWQMYDNTNDADFISPQDQKTISKAMQELGFEKHGKEFRHNQEEDKFNNFVMQLNNNRKNKI